VEAVGARTLDDRLSLRPTEESFIDQAARAARIARAPVLIVNNTGPAHMAAAAGTPVVDL